MTAKECADIWKEIIKIYNETRDKTPETTVKRIIEKFGKEKTYTVFATVSKIKKHDGRIYGKNRKVMDATPYVPEATDWRFGNPMVSAGLDDIHTTHINQMIGALIDLG